MSAEKSLSLLKITQRTRKIILHAEEVAKQVESSVLGKLITELDTENKPSRINIFGTVEKFLQESFAPEQLDNSLKNKLNQFSKSLEPKENTSDYTILMKEFLKFVCLASLKTENNDKIEELNKFLDHLQECLPGNTEKLEVLNIYLSLGDEIRREFYHNYNITRAQVIGELSSVRERLEIHIEPCLDYLLSVRKSSEIKDQYYLLPIAEIQMLKIHSLLSNFPEIFRDSLLRSKEQFLEAFEEIVSEYTPTKIRNILNAETNEDKQELEIFKSRIEPFVSEGGHFELFSENEEGQWDWDQERLRTKRRELKENHPAQRILEDLAREETIDSKSLNENLFEEKKLIAKLRSLLDSQDPENTTIAIRTIWLMGENFPGNSILQFVKIYQALIQGKEEAIGSILPEEYKFILDRITILAINYLEIYREKLTNDPNSLTLLEKIRVRAPIQKEELITIPDNFITALQPADYKQLIFRPDIDLFLKKNSKEFLFNLLYYATKFDQFELAKKILEKVKTNKDAFLSRIQINEQKELYNLAFQKDKIQFAKLFLSQLSPKEQAKNGFKFLYTAYKEDNLELARYLVEYLNIPIEKLKSPLNSTILIMAAQAGKTKFVELCLEKIKPHKKINQKKYLERKDKAGYTALNVACHYGNTKIVELLLQEGANINTTDTRNRTPLMLAASQGYTEIVRLLLDTHKADLETKTARGDNALLVAIDQGHTEIVELLLKKGAQIYPTGKNKDSALGEAASRGKIEILEIIFRLRADTIVIEHKDSGGNTALALAAYNGRSQALQFLISKGAEIETINEKGNTPLITAIQNNHIKTVKVLLKHGANISTKNKKGLTALDIAGKSTNPEMVSLFDPPPTINEALVIAAAEGPRDTVALLLTKGADINTTNKDGYTPLMIAIAKGHIEVVRVLLSKNKENIENKMYGYTALAIAADNGHSNIVELLLNEGANINTTAPEGWTPLMLAIYKGHIEVVRVLLSKNKENIEAKNINDCTALALAADNGHTDVVDLLLEAGADINTRYAKAGTPLILAAAKGYTAIVRLLLNKNKENIEAKNINGGTALTLAAGNGHKDVVGLLLDAGADIKTTTLNGYTPLIMAATKGHTATVRLLLSKNKENLESKNINGDTALIRAVVNEHKDIVELLLQEGADINTINESRDSALGLAAYLGKIEILETLFALRADILEIEHKNNLGNTPLALASYNGQSQALEFLIKKGGDIETVNEKGNTPLITAVENNHVDAVKVLLEHNANISTKNNEGLTALDIAKKSTNPEMVSLFNSLSINPTSVFKEGARISGNDPGASVA